MKVSVGSCHPVFRSTAKALVMAWVAVGQGMGLSEAEVQCHQVDIRTTPHSSPQGASQLVCSGDSSFSKYPEYWIYDSATSPMALSRRVRGWRDLGLIKGESKDHERQQLTTGFI